MAKKAGTKTKTNTTIYDSSTNDENRKIETINKSEHFAYLKVEV